MGKNETEVASLEDQLAAELLAFWEDADLEIETLEESDRRGRPRAKFPYMQLVAPVRGTHRPAEHDLRQVRCEDISVSGFAYYDLIYPECEELIVGFGTWPKMIYLKAQIVNVTPAMVDGEYLFRVGCRYTERVSLEEEAAEPVESEVAQ